MKESNWFIDRHGLRGAENLGSFFLDFFWCCSKKMGEKVFVYTALTGSGRVKKEVINENSYRDK